MGFVDNFKKSLEENKKRREAHLKAKREFYQRIKEAKRDAYLKEAVVQSRLRAKHEAKKRFGVPPKPVKKPSRKLRYPTFQDSYSAPKKKKKGKKKQQLFEPLEGFY